MKILDHIAGSLLGGTTIELSERETRILYTVMGSCTLSHANDEGGRMARTLKLRLEDIIQHQGDKTCQNKHLKNSLDEKTSG